MLFLNRTYGRSGLNEPFLNFCSFHPHMEAMTKDFCYINVFPYESTAETYLQSLQFRIIHRYFPCRYNIHLWNIVGDNKCEFCNDGDTLSHYFTECDSVVQFWKILKRWFIRTFQLVRNFTSLV